MRHHYWEWPIAIYLFLGGLGGGILALTWILDLVFGVASLFVASVFIGVLCLGLGCFFLVFELGQPPVFWRVFTTATAIIKWGAVLLSVAMIAAFIYVVSFLGWGWTDMFIPARGACLALAGITGACVMIYTGVLLASLKAHSFWSTPALPVLFTVSALSTASAAMALSMGVWPLVTEPVVLAVMHEFLHMADMCFVIVELVVLLIYVLLLLGAGNVVAKGVAQRWVAGKTAPLFWGGMVGVGLVLPLVCYFAGGVLASYVAPILVLCGGVLLRFLVVYSDDRQSLPGENRFYSRLPKGDEAFLTAWKDRENLY